jgi:hypothetical protein
MATLWKAILSADFVTGQFFTLTLLLDGRFTDVAVVYGGVPQTFVDYTQYVFHRVRIGMDAALPLPIPQRLLELARVLTWWTIVVEAALGLLYVLPAWRAVGTVRDVLLIGFVASTYAVAPVIGFGWLLLMLGVVQAPSGSWRRGAFLLSFAVVLIYSVTPIVAGVGEQLGTPIAWDSQRWFLEASAIPPQ